MIKFANVLVDPHEIIAVMRKPSSDLDYKHVEIVLKCSGTLHLTYIHVKEVDDFERKLRLTKRLTK